MSSTRICDELLFIIRMELARGNELATGPEVANWPRQGSVFASLKSDLAMSGYSVPSGVRHSICTDLHYGWHDECHCEIHGDLLVAGTTHQPGS